MPWSLIKHKHSIVSICKSDHNPIVTRINVIHLPFNKVPILPSFMNNGRNRNRIPPYLPNQTTSK